MRELGPERDDRHLDHRVPIIKGGEHSKRNVVWACPPCNLSKNDSLPKEWRPKLKEALCQKK